MHRIYLYMMGPAVLAALGVGCSSSSAPTDELQRVIGGLGGLADVQAATSQSATATGKRYDQHEAFSAVPGIHDETTLQMTFTSTVVTDLDGEGLYGRWDGTTVEVFPGTHPIWTETSDGKFGYTTGTTSGFPPTDAAPMLSAQVIARRKQHVMATPIALVKYALANPSTVTIGPCRRCFRPATTRTARRGARARRST